MFACFDAMSVHLHLINVSTQAKQGSIDCSHQCKCSRRPYCKTRGRVLDATLSSQKYQVEGIDKIHFYHISDLWLKIYPGKIN